MEYRSVVNSKRSLYEWNDPDICFDTDPPCDAIEGIFQETKPISSQEKVYVKNSVLKIAIHQIMAGQLIAYPLIMLKCLLNTLHFIYVLQ